MRARITVLTLLFPWTLACTNLFAAENDNVAGNIVELWNQVSAPPAPNLAAPVVKANKTAFLLLDIEKSNCSAERRPRCVAAVPVMAAFLGRARAMKMAVMYSTTNAGSRGSILAPVAPQDDDKIVKASVNKFFGTRLDEYLHEQGVTTLVVCGTAAYGAVLHTVTNAAIAGYQIVLPVDCMPGSSLYEEQSSLWSLLNGPGTARSITATTLNAITIE